MGGSHVSAGGVRKWPDTMAEKIIGEKVRQVELENRQLRRQVESAAAKLSAAQRKAEEQQAAAAELRLQLDIYLQAEARAAEPPPQPPRRPSSPGPASAPSAPSAPCEACAQLERGAGPLAHRLAEAMGRLQACPHHGLWGWVWWERVHTPGRRLHTPCTRHAHAMRTPCARHAHAMQMTHARALHRRLRPSWRRSGEDTQRRRRSWPR